MKGFTIAAFLFVAVFATTARAAPEGTREHPAKFTAADAARAPKHHAPGGDEGPAVAGEPSAAHESKRLRRSLKVLSEVLHGVSGVKLVAIPLAHGAKAAASIKAGSEAKGLSKALSVASRVLSAKVAKSVASAKAVAAVATGAKVAVGVVKPVLIAGKVLSHKVNTVHTLGKIVHHKVDKLHHF